MISSTPMPALPLTFDSPALLAVGLALGAVIITVAWTRRLPLPRTSLTLSIAGVLLLAVACGHPVWLARPARVVDVMVDLSPSTRGATYRDDATLRRRVGQLINNVPFRITCFSQVNRPDNGTIAPLEMPAEQTVFTPPANADAILLFSDGQFVLPDAAPPTYTVVDPALDDPADAAAERLEIRGDQLAATIRNRGTPREMTWDIGEARGAETIEDGSFVLPRPLPASATSVSVRLAPGDAWPENDALTLATPPPARAERWWIGAASAPAPWRAIAPAALSIDPAVYLAPAVIVLDNVAADDLSDLQQQRLQQYVRDLGGGVVILGGDRAFGAGGYVGSALDTISPLASSPPASTVHWIVLVDSSGSMLARWESATGALTGLLPHLPPADTLSAGNFAAGVRWWVERVNVSEARAMALPPRDVLPHGPTNLAAALRAVAGAERGNGPTELLLLTDAEAKLDDVDALVTSLAEKKVRIHLLGVAPIAADNPVRRVVAGTGGVLLEQTDPRHWAESFGQLMRQAMPQRLSNNPIEVQFEARLGTLAARPVVPWNRTWLKPGSDKLASAQAPHGPAPMAAAWSVGAGQVAAAAFGANVAETTALAELVAAPPRDPRLKVTWESGPQLRVTLDAVDEQRYLNGLAATLEIMAQDTSVTPTLPATQPVPQTAPGRYELWTSAPRAPSFAALRVGGRVVARAAVAGRYAPEFDAIGTDYVALRELARRSGGEVIEPTRTSPINFRWPPRRVALTSYLAITGASLVAAALAWWRCRG